MDLTHFSHTESPVSAVALGTPWAPDARFVGRSVDGWCQLLRLLRVGALGEVLAPASSCFCLFVFFSMCAGEKGEIHCFGMKCPIAIN